MSTGFAWHELYMWHDPGSGAGPRPAGGAIEPGEHGESAPTKRRLRNLLEVSGLLDDLVPLRPRPATREELTRFHTEAYVDRIKALSDQGGGDAGENTPFGGGSYEIAVLAAGGALRAVDAVLAGEVDNAYALVRPPGHHAEADRGRGFCIFGNTALAAFHAREAHGLERVAIVDWDVHHGNGTESAFYDDPSVLTISLHQDDWWPRGRGGLADVGEGPGAGLNINVPLPAGSGAGAYCAAFETVVAPALAAFRPQVILVACGFDASVLDPLGRMMLTSEAFRELTRMAKAAAAELCDGRLVLVHEGGYSAAYVPFCGLAVLEELAGVRTGVEDPYLARYRGVPGEDLQPAQRDAVAVASAIALGQRPVSPHNEKGTLMSELTPQVIPFKPENADVNTGPGPKIARLINKKTVGDTHVMLGVNIVEPGERGVWSFEGDVDLDKGHYGEVDEVYFVLSGKLRIWWDGGEMTAVANDSVYLPRGYSYQLENISDETSLTVYAIAPAAF
jgi:acetoin utilization deacetylase AcuC-like enzyme/mannose-6-phosphate isomerase-like protein (cupin superfamily)